MAGITALDKLLRTMRPELMPGEFVFCTVPGTLADYLNLSPAATFMESEGLTLLLSKAAAQTAGLGFENSYRQITLTVHSSLDAVGLTAAVSAKLTEHDISTNVIAAYYHDHIFVQNDKATAALDALEEFSESA